MQGPLCGKKGTAGGKVLGECSGFEFLVLFLSAAKQQARVRQGEQRLVV